MSDVVVVTDVDVANATAARAATIASESAREHRQQQHRADVLSPVSAVALGNCVRLLQKFCDDTDTPTDVGASRATLVKYLVESSSKIAGWRRTIERKIGECSDRSEQLARLQTLVHELEHKVANQQRVVDAACTFARAYKTLRSSVSAQSFTTGEFYAACKCVVEAVRAPSAASQVDRTHTTAGAGTARHSRPVRLATVHEQRELGSSRNSTTASAAATMPVARVPRVSISSVAASAAAVQCGDPQQPQGNRSSIAVGSLRNVNDIHAPLERALADESALLTHAHARLEHQSAQFAMLRAFLHWKATTYTLRMHEQTVEACVVDDW